MPQEINGRRSIDKRKSRVAVQTPQGPAFSAPIAVHHSTAVIPSQNLGRWIEPWYVAYAILGALASGSAVILIPLAVIGRGGSATQVGAAIAALNVGALFAPFWGWLSDRFKDYRPIFFGGFLLIGAGFLSFALTGNASMCPGRRLSHWIWHRRFEHCSLPVCRRVHAGF